MFLNREDDGIDNPVLGRVVVGIYIYGKRSGCVGRCRSISKIAFCYLALSDERSFIWRGRRVIACQCTEDAEGYVQSPKKIPSCSCPCSLKLQYRASRSGRASERGKNRKEETTIIAAACASINDRRDRKRRGPRIVAIACANMLYQQGGNKNTMQGQSQGPMA